MWRIPARRSRTSPHAREQESQGSKRIDPEFVLFLRGDTAATSVSELADEARTLTYPHRVGSKKKNRHDNVKATFDSCPKLPHRCSRSRRLGAGQTLCGHRGRGSSQAQERRGQHVSIPLAPQLLSRSCGMDGPTLEGIVKHRQLVRWALYRRPRLCDCVCPPELVTETIFHSEMVRVGPR